MIEIASCRACPLARPRGGEWHATSVRFATGACLTWAHRLTSSLLCGRALDCASVGPRSTPPAVPGQVPFSESRTRSSPSLVDSFEIASQIRGVFVFALEFAVSRAYWNGFLKLSFVSCPVALYPATTAAERVSFRQVNRRTGHRLKHQLVDSVTGEAVETQDKARGYEVGNNRFLLVENRELDQARSERPPPGTVQLAEPPRPAPALPQSERPTPKRTTRLKKNRAAKRMPKRRSRKRTRLPSSRARRTPAPSKSSASSRRGRLTLGI